jgi:hypothetical protein
MTSGTEVRNVWSDESVKWISLPNLMHRGDALAVYSAAHDHHQDAISRTGLPTGTS